MQLICGAVALAGAAHLAAGSPSAASGAASGTSPYFGRWAVSEDRPVFTARGRLYKTIDVAPCGRDFCGVSVDDGDSHAAFARKYNLPFALLADRNGEVAGRHGSLRDFGFLKFAKRNTFLIDPNGRIARVWLGVSPSKHSAEVLAALTELAR